ncbi:ribonuclease HII [Helicobacter mesocricetorum]|uniref:ribonuclease HII n=1 Tax=Helicobacter mesocricetorum TaxID=87012 RepID=UPI000CF0D4E6|nr:ribonuclease HII [Helicobacter mesocricetorum]
MESLLPPDYDIVVCGIDEAGRGCIAGSLFVCGVILSPNIPLALKAQLKDSKSLSETKRNMLAPLIQRFSDFYLVKKTHQEIDDKGLSLCLQEALKEILQNLKAPKYIFDGNCKFGVDLLQTLIKGDSKLPCISAASILAKNAKDKEMIDLDTLYPQYGFKKNKGYGSKEHLKAIKDYGYCPIHRISFKLKSLM